MMAADRGEEHHEQEVQVLRQGPNQACLIDAREEQLRRAADDGLQGPRGIERERVTCDRPEHAHQGGGGEDLRQDRKNVRAATQSRVEEGQTRQHHKHHEQ